VFTVAGVVQSRRDNNLAGRFPEIVGAARRLGDLVLDGELVALREGKLDFGALTSFPASRAGAGVTIYYIAFDLLADCEDDLREQPYRARRARLEEVFTGVAPPLQLTPSTTDRAEAMQWMQPDLATIGIEGVVAKDTTQPYRAGRSRDWRKIRSVGSQDVYRTVRAGRRYDSVCDGCNARGSHGHLSVTGSARWADDPLSGSF
jgi:ATP-dependent DNA ligase